MHCTPTALLGKPQSLFFISSSCIQPPWCVLPLGMSLASFITAGLLAHAAMHARRLAAGLCMAPCMQPWVEDDSCSISTTPAGDTLTFKMPAASMGLSTMQQQQHSIVPVEAAGAAGAPGVAAGAPDGACGAGMFSCCSCCQASASSGCICSVGAEGLPGGVPSTAQPSSQAADAVAFGPGGAAAAAHAASSVPSVDESWEVPEQAGCCVVEGDVRLVVSHVRR